MEITVNGEAIPRSLFEQERDRLHMNPESPPYDELEDLVRDTLIARALIRQEAARSEVSIPKEKVESSLVDMIEEAGGEDRFYRRYGITSEKKDLVVEEIEITLKVECLLNEIGGNTSEPTDEEIRAYYDENAGDLVDPEEIEAMHIVMTPHCEHEAAETYNQMRTVRKELLAGTDFEEMALLHSANGKDDHGKLGRFTRGSMVPEFETVAFSMTPGEISPVFQTQFGYHIVKLTDARPERTLTLEEASSKIVDALKRDQKNKLVEEWVEERKKSASIIIND